MEEKVQMLKELQEAGLKLAYDLNEGSDYGTEYLDRTIYHTVYVTDTNGNVMLDGSGNKIMRNQALYIAGSWISKKEYEAALQVEKDFKELNDRLREGMTARKYTWHIPKTSQRVLTIQGVTGA